MKFQDYYQTLGVPRTASQAEIKKAFRRLARENHPDAKPDDAVPFVRAVATPAQIRTLAANKVVGVRASLCHDTYSAHQGVEHDDMNVICLGARVHVIFVLQNLVHDSPGLVDLFGRIEPHIVCVA